MVISSYLTGALRLGLAVFVLIACAGNGENGSRNAGGTATQNTGGSTSSNTGASQVTQKTGGQTESGGSGNPGTGGMMDGTGGMDIMVPPVAGSDYFRTDDANRNDVTAGNVCDRVTQLQCAAEQECCSNPGRTFDECYTKLIVSCRDAAYLDAMSANNITGFDPVRGKAAMEMFEQLAKDCDTSVASWVESADGLRGIMQGTKAKGASCLPISAQKEVAAAYLASCQDPANLSCLPMTTLSWSCQTRGEVDATCVTDLNCVPGLYCPQANYQNPQLDSNCAVRLADGSPCIANNECMSFACKSGSCVPISKDATYCLD